MVFAGERHELRLLCVNVPVDVDDGANIAILQVFFRQSRSLAAPHNRVP